MKLFLITTIVFIISIDVYCQGDTMEDSLYIGKSCKIILFNDFEITGTITRYKTDTVWIKNESREYRIPYVEIKYVLKPGEDTNQREEDAITEDKIKADITNECDVVVSGRRMLKDVQLIYENDSSLSAFKNQKYTNVQIKNVLQIIFKPKTPFLKGALIGSGIGFLGGFFTFAFNTHHGHPDFSGPGAGVIFGLLLLIPSGLIGGVIGVLASHDDIFKFEQGLKPSKIKRIRYIIHQHS